MPERDVPGDHLTKHLNLELTIDADMPDEVKSKGGATIEEGDTVNTPYRGGKHEGEVIRIQCISDDVSNISGRTNYHRP